MKQTSTLLRDGQPTAGSPHVSLLDLLEELNLHPKRTGSEFHTSCPLCGGTDRFCVWPKQGPSGRYWCRQCQKRGDAIQFCRDFLGLSYAEACAKLGMAPKQTAQLTKTYQAKKNNFLPKAAVPPSEKWRATAMAFVDRSHAKLLACQNALEEVLKRGFSVDTINNSRFGWNPSNIFDSRAAWGLPSLIKNDGKEKTQWLPKGIVIPAFENGIARIKIRRSEWHVGDKYPKYVEIPGSMQRPSFYGPEDKPIVIVESELDAILIQQFCSDLCRCLALGGASNRPDALVHTQLQQASFILLALDYDQGGRTACPFWMSLYSHLRPWPASQGKSPGDAYKLHSIDLRKWVQDGLRFSNT